MACSFGHSLVLALLLCLAPWSRAELITFEFASPTGSTAGITLDGLSTGMVIALASGVEVALHATAGEPGSGDEFNHTNSPNFGINAAGAGDVTDAFDAGAGTSEFLDMYFTASVPATFELLEVDFDRVSGAGGPGEDAGILSFASGHETAFDGRNVDSADRLAVGFVLSAGETLRLAHVDGNGFGLESLIVDVRPEPATTVPEPAALTLIALGSAVLFIKRVATS